MSLGVPKMLTSLEEDLKAIGLLDETKCGKEEAEKKTPPTAKPADDDDGAEADEATKPSDADAALDEVRQVRLKRHTGAERRKARQYRKKHLAKIRVSRRKRERKPSTKKREKKLRALGAKLRHGKPAGRRRIQLAGLDRVSTMIENVQNTIAGMKNINEAEAIKGFAQVAIIADMLSRAFERVALKESDRDILLASKICDALAEDASEVAASLDDLRKARKAGKATEAVLSNEDIEEEFKDAISTLLDSLELYSDVTEADDEDEDEDAEGKE